MNLDKLKQAEAEFLQRYPGGFDDPEIKSIKKKHNVDKLIEFARENFTPADCKHPAKVASSLLKIATGSSMVSRFEKPAFREFIEDLSGSERRQLADAVANRLHGKKQQGFESMLELLSRHKLAKWSLISVMPFYYYPQREVFVKPTTAKGIVSYLEVKDLVYHSHPSWQFYQGYRKLIASIKKEVVPSLAPNNAALTGFLMMSY